MVPAAVATLHEAEHMQPAQGKHRHTGFVAAAVAVAEDIHHFRIPLPEVRPDTLRQGIPDMHRGQNSLVGTLVRAVVADRVVDTFYLVMSVVAGEVVVTAAVVAVVAAVWREQGNGGGNLVQTFGGFNMYSFL